MCGKKRGGKRGLAGEVGACVVKGEKTVVFSTSVSLG